MSEYHPSLDTRDILWKRVARATDGTIHVRVREANIRKTVSIGIAVESHSDEERVRRMDLISEAIAQIGIKLLPLGTAVEVELPRGFLVQFEGIESD